MKIFIVGFMGAGKSTVGKRLADRLGFKFYDTDNVIQKMQGLSIEEIFEQRGGDFFRELEKNVLKNIALSPYCAVVACGGGVVTLEDNVKLMKERGVIVWLYYSFEDFWRRYSESLLEDRPLLKNKSKGELVRLFEEREALYAKCSDFKVVVSRKDPDAIVGDILCFLNQKYRATTG